MSIVIETLAVGLATVAGALAVGNVFVIGASILHRRKDAMRALQPFSRIVSLLLLSDTQSDCDRPKRRV